MLVAVNGTQRLKGVSTYIVIVKRLSNPKVYFLLVPTHPEFVGTVLADVWLVRLLLSKKAKAISPGLTLGRCFFRLSSF